jgi:hypothetical protein
MEEYQDSSMAQYQLLGKDPIQFMMPVSDQYVGSIPNSTTNAMRDGTKLSESKLE